MSIFDHTERESPQKYTEELVRSLYKDADQKNINFSSEKQPVTTFKDGVTRGTIIPTYADLQRTVQSLTNELDDWKKKYITLYTTLERMRYAYSITQRRLTDNEVI